jgi:hypothetical protein
MGRRVASSQRPRPLVAAKRQLVGAKLGGRKLKPYIGLMGSVALLIRCLPLIAAGMLSWPQAATAQTFSADYALRRSFIVSAQGGALRLPGGYRWSDGQALSLQLAGAGRGSRLGLAVRYEWPRYFVRLSYETGINPTPQDNLRFSAGIRF